MRRGGWARRLGAAALALACAGSLPALAEPARDKKAATSKSSASKPSNRPAASKTPAK
jgi:hypothetical protein